MSSNTHEYQQAMLAFLCPDLPHPLSLTQEYVTQQLSRVELEKKRGPDNKGEGIPVRMASLEAIFIHRRLEVYPTTFDAKHVHDLMKKIYLSTFPVINFPEFDLFKEKEPSTKEMRPLAWIAVGRCCRHLGYYVPKVLSESTVLCILGMLYAIMVDRRARPGATINIHRQPLLPSAPNSWKPPSSNDVKPPGPGHAMPVPSYTCRDVQLTQEKPSLPYDDDSDTAEDSELDEEEPSPSKNTRHALNSNNFTVRRSIWSRIWRYVSRKN